MADKEKGPGGRPTKYDPEFCQMVVDSMKAGYSKTATAGFIGVCKSTFDNWCKEHDEFLAAVKEGEALRTLKLEGDLLASPDGPTVTSRIFALKNAAPAEWRDKREHEVTGKDGGPVEHKVTTMDLSKLSEDELAKLAEIKRKMEGEDE